MKIKDVTKTKDEALYEAIDKKNNTGVNTSDLVKVIKARTDKQWKKFNTVNDVMAWLEGDN